MRIPLVLAAILMAVSVLIDIYITYDLKRLSKKRIWSKIYFGTSVLFWIWLIVIFCLPKRNEDAGIVYLMWMLYSYLTVYLAKFVYLVVTLSGRILRKALHARTKQHPAHWTALACAFVVVAVMWSGTAYTRHHIMVTRVDIWSQRLPEGFNGFTIAQISDLHVGTWGKDTTFVSNLVDSVNALSPDLIVFTGDIVNRETTELKPFISVLSRLHAPYGVLSVLGNHDYGDYVDWPNPADRLANNRQLAADEAKMGWHLLNNDRVVIKCGNDSIIVAGVENWGDPPFHTYADMEKALPSSPDSIVHQNDDNFKVLLTHNPEHWNQVTSSTTNIDLTLSGHTHAMQAMIKSGDWQWSPAGWRYPLWGGLYERVDKEGDNVQLYVNIGSGEVGMPSRLLQAYPEITLLTLRR